MRERFDCAVLPVPYRQAQMEALPGNYLSGRVLIHELPLPAQQGEFQQTGHILHDAALALRRYDVCLLTVTPDNLPWVRTNLQMARGVLRTPVIVLAHDLAAAPLIDLLHLGAADFMVGPLRIEELRARCARAVTHGNAQAQAQADGAGRPYALNATPPLTAKERPPLRDYRMDYDTAIEQLSADRAGQAAKAPAGTQAGGKGATKQTTGLPETVSQALEHYAFDLVFKGGAGGTGTVFKNAKLQLVEKFETAYIQTSLHRHAGNITMAARSANKHRRAFWAMMQKYGIEPDSYRVGWLYSTRPY